MEKVKVLAVAPYVGMKDVIDSLAAARDDLDVTTVVGNMEEGADLVASCDQSKYDVVISRGGTAECIREVASIPVIEIELTPYDVRNALSSVTAPNKTLAVAGSPKIAEAAATMCDILGINVNIFTFRDCTEAKQILPQMKQKGIDMILCDVIGAEAAAEMDMGSVLITSGVMGIEDALNRAASYFSSFGRVKMAHAIFRAELKAAGESLAVLSTSGQLIFSSPEPTVAPALRKLLERSIPSVLSSGSWSATRPVGNKDYLITAYAIRYKDTSCVAYRIHCQGLRLPVSTPGVRKYDSSKKDMLRISRHYGGQGAALIERAEKIAQSGLPALICGERGTLTESVAGYICMYGMLSEGDCCVVDCSVVSSKGWTKLLGQSGLVSFRPGTTVLFDKVMDLPDGDIERLVQFIQDAGLTRQLRIVFSMTTGLLPRRELSMIKLISDTLYCVVLELPPLRDKNYRLTEAINNSFTYVCADMGIRCPDIEPSAMEKLLGYSWPRNLPQLHRVVTQLVVDSNGGGISESMVQKILEMEKISVYQNSGELGTIDLNGTLDDINRRIVRQVLVEEEMNRSRTARRLGISRATLWRILNRDDASEGGT